MGSQLDWIPLYIDKLLASQRWRLMEDYERGWYWSLIVESARSERPGYLRLDVDLWRLAGARSRQFFEGKNARVLACFKREEIDGFAWIYSARLVRTLEEQHGKLKRKTDSYSYSPENLEVDLGIKPPGSDELIERIAKLYPGNWRAKGQIQIPQAQCIAIIGAIARDGVLLVEQGTQAYADVVSMWPVAERKFVMRATDFFGVEAHYLKDPRIWERGNGEPSKAKQRTDRNREVLVRTEQRYQGAGDGRSVQDIFLRTQPDRGRDVEGDAAAVPGGRALLGDGGGTEEVDVHAETERVPGPGDRARAQKA